MITALLLNTFFLLAPLERPALTIAIGQVESGNKVKAIGKKKEKGAFQVREKHWGKVPKKWKDQADQQERILNELLDDHDGKVIKSIESYNGCGIKAREYARKVLKKTIEIHVLDIA